MSYDILVVGSGIAGMMAAIEAKELGSNVAIVMKKSPLANNSFMAKGGINAALNNMGDGDSIEQHIQDTLKGGMGIAEEEAVRIFCEHAPQVVRELHRKYKVPFTTLPDGRLAQRPFGGTKFKRTCYSADATGPAIMKTLNKVIQELNIPTIKNHFALNLLVNNGVIAGVSFLDEETNEVKVIKAKAVIMATGGYAGLYRGYTTNVTDATGDGIAMGLRAGLEGMDLEFIQFHPTGLAGTNYLISEAARAEGGRLINSDGNEFVDELNTRDFVTRAIVKQLQKGKQVYLDLTDIPEEVINTKLIHLKKRVKSLKKIDITKEPIPINPLAHYTMGGIKTDTYAFTDIEGLFYVGEAGNNGVNGANRLGGNSLSEGAVFGKIAGYEAVKYSHRVKNIPEIKNEDIQKDIELIEKLKNTKIDTKKIKHTLGDILYRKVGIIRNGYTLKKAIGIFEDLKKEMQTNNNEIENDSSIKEKLECINGIDLAIATAKSALQREESRGAHFRLDFPETDFAFQKHTFVKI
ncbi:L-aspartate oxidase [Caminibacter mediatlanticus]|uniref:Fumarate reductase flavoprotein subunit n=1 Tax=Caminibacter mediatlanticus TB-2 TaxID=391592 RepID=A0AAI9AIL6_9BACT|nr:FAD-dependent oxidoreductase [Caminibacter mediatlanticus]EDM24265.1 fumarate reductase flavoprotein subunit [Caminibacter mediatlanticus TB-2]